MGLKDFHTVYHVLSPPLSFPRFSSPRYPQIYILFVFIQRKKSKTNKATKLQKYHMNKNIFKHTHTWNTSPFCVFEVLIIMGLQYLVSLGENWYSCAGFHNLSEFICESFYCFLRVIHHLWLLKSPYFHFCIDTWTLRG